MRLLPINCTCAKCDELLYEEDNAYGTVMCRECGTINIISRGYIYDPTTKEFNDATRVWDANADNS